MITNNENIDYDALLNDDEPEISSFALIPQLKNMPTAEEASEIANRAKALLGASLAILSTSDLINFGGKPFIQHEGAKKLAGLFGYTVRANEKDGCIAYEKVLLDQNTGDYYISVTGRIFPKNNPSDYEIYEGRCPAMSSFFEEHHGGNVSNVSLVPLFKVRDKALANFMGRAVKKKLGINFTWEEISQFTGGKITQEKVKGFGFKNKDQGAKEDTAEVQDIRKKTWNMLAEMYQGNKEEIEAYLITLTTFTGKDGATISGKGDINKISEKQLMKAVYPTVKKDYQEIFGG